MRFIRIAVVFVLAISLFALAGCGGGAGGAGGGAESGGQPATTGGKALKTITVKEAEFTLDPAKIVLNKPGIYVFRAQNVGTIPHALTVEGQGIKQSTEVLSPGQSAQIQVNLKAGRYAIYCPVAGHRQQGQEGTLTVG